MTTQLRNIEERAGRLLSLEGKVAMVTGAASGIGRGIAIRLAEMGAFVSILDIDDIKGRASAVEIEAHGGEAVFLNCDVRSAAECRRAVETVRQRSGKIDILCNCSRAKSCPTWCATAEAASSTSVRDGRSREGRGPRPTALPKVAPSI